MKITLNYITKYLFFNIIKKYYAQPYSIDQISISSRTPNTSPKIHPSTAPNKTTSANTSNSSPSTHPTSKNTPERQRQNPTRSPGRRRGRLRRLATYQKHSSAMQRACNLGDARFSSAAHPQNRPLPKTALANRPRGQMTF